MDARKLATFSFSGIIFLFVVGLGAAWKQGWFYASTMYRTSFERGDGVFPGTPVQFSGIRIGEVTNVELLEDGHVNIEFAVKNKFTSWVKEDSLAQLSRPFIIGERQITLMPGSKGSALVERGGSVRGVSTMEIMDLFDGARMGPYLETATKVLDQLNILFADSVKAGGKSLPDLYDQTFKALQSIVDMQKEIYKLRTGFVETPEMQTMVKNLSQATNHLEETLVEVNKSFPQIRETLDATNTTMGAAQRSLFLSGATKQYQAEQEARKASSKQRVPASTK